MKKHCSNNTKLYITEDIYSNAYFIRTQVEKVGRFYQRDNRWFLWLYIYKYTRTFNTLTELLEFAERMYKKYWRENYEIHDC